MRRREFITLIGGAAATWPATAISQQPMPVVGYLHSESPQAVARLLAAFREGLAQTGYIEGRNVAVEYRWAQGDSSHIRELADDLVRLRVSVIATPGSSAAALAAKAATTTIPIVFSIGLDPVEIGLVSTLNRPAGNITGINSMSNELGPKRIGILHELLPAAVRFAVLVNPENPTTKATIEGLQTAATAINRQLEVVSASTEADINTALARVVERHADGFLVHPDNLFIRRRAQLVMLAARNAVPAICPFRTDAEAGGLMSYGVSLPDAHRQAGVYVGCILKGEKAADLPVVQPTVFELIINLKTAKALGITIAPSLLGRADEVIE